MEPSSLPDLSLHISPPNTKPALTPGYSFENDGIQRLDLLNTRFSEEHSSKCSDGSKRSRQRDGDAPLELSLASFDFQVGKPANGSYLDQHYSITINGFPLSYTEGCIRLSEGQEEDRRLIMECLSGESKREAIDDAIGLGLVDSYSGHAFQVSVNKEDYRCSVNNENYRCSDEFPRDNKVIEAPFFRPHEDILMNKMMTPSHPHSFSDFEDHFQNISSRPGEFRSCNPSVTTSDSHSCIKSKFMTKRRCMRAPRMRWTSTLHAHFVHAVKLLGGHESMYQCLVIFHSAIITRCRFYVGVGLNDTVSLRLGGVSQK